MAVAAGFSLPLLRNSAALVIEKAAEFEKGEL